MSDDTRIAILRKHNDTVLDELAEMARLTFDTDNASLHATVLFMEAHAKAIDHALSRLMLMIANGEVQP